MPPIRRFLDLVRKCSTGVVGKVTWEPPAWTGALGRWVVRRARWIGKHPLPALGVLTLAVSLVLGSTWLVRWYANRPKPVTTSVSITAPPLTKIEKDARPQPLVITFGRSAAPLEQIGKVVAQGCELSPSIGGKWRWATDRRLTFTPEQDWPVGRPMTVLIRPGLLAEQVRLERYQLPFTTEPFHLTVESLRFYQDPRDPKLKKAVATLRFSHPVHVPSLERSVSLRLLGESPQPQRYTLSYDELKGRAYLHSAPITITEKEQRMELSVEAGVRARSGGPPTDSPHSSRLAIPGRYNHLRVEQMQLAIATGGESRSSRPFGALREEAARFSLSQLLVVPTSLSVDPKEVRRSLSAHLLPLHHPDERDRREPYAWSDPALIGPQILKRARPIRLTPVSNSEAEGRVHSFGIKVPVGRYVYVRVKKGMRSVGDFVLGRTEDSILQVPDFPKLVKIVHPGAVLALGGEHKVAVYARDVPGLRFEIGRVLPGQIHTMVTQSDPTFTTPEFWRGIGPDHLTELFTEERALPAGAPGTGRYHALDLSRYLDGRNGRQGLFLLKVQAYDPKRKEAEEPIDRRLVLVTNLGLVVKDQEDGSHVVFVQSLRSGAPVAGAKVEVLGQNGLPVAGAVTDGGGMARLPSVGKRVRTETPTLYLVRSGADMAFMPYGRHGRYLNLSRFNIGGITDSELPGGLSAYLFSDRGLYRPGDEIRVGMIVKARGWTRNLTGLPLEATVTDPRGLVIRRQKLRLGAAGFEELRHTTSENALTGRYGINLHVVKDNQAGGLLGSTSVRVREFLPDRMKIRAALSARAPHGWVSPEGLKASVTLENLFGTAAAGRRVRATLHLSPAHPRFSGFPDYRFHDWLETKRSLTDELPDGTTDAKGQVGFDLELERFEAGTYQLRFVAEGFESKGGRSVVAETGAIVSPLPYLVGYKADGELHYVSRGSQRAVELVAVGPDGKALAVDHLTRVLIERRHVSVLTRQPDGTYRYESRLREREIRQRKLKIGARPRKLALPTGRPGDFVLVVRNTKGTDLCRVPFSVAGEANIDRSLERNAELQLSLQESDVAAGEELQLQIRAPFTCAGLITIERDRVYSHRWFRSNTTASVHRIRVPRGLEGNAYVGVTCLRDPSSPEVLISPLSYGVAPFTVSRQKRTTTITLTTAERSRPGEPFTIRYRTDRRSKIVVFAVDEGIVRVARYSRPDPLAHFFAKRALQVRTAQILDLVLPEFAQLTSAPGGGGDYDDEMSASRSTLGANLNPFRRRRDKPVTFWSGILDAGPAEQQVVYQVPDHFNGSLRVMAVAVAPDAVGATQQTAVVRGDFVISPNLPLFAVPGDRFTVSVGVANTFEGSPPRARVNLSLETSGHLKLLGPARTTLTIPRLGEATARFQLKATDQLGSASLTLVARCGAASSRRRVDLSVRPAGSFLTTISVGRVEPGKSIEIPVERRLFAQHRSLEVGVSPLPLGLAHGLIRYLEHFPHGCTEQAVSQAMPAMVLSRRPEFGLDGVHARRSLERVLELLRGRQNDEGAFGLWAANSHISEFATVYALHFLIEAKERGFDLPPDLLQRGLGWLHTLTTSEGDDLHGERLRAYGLYLLARAGRVVGGRAALLHKRLDRRFPKVWRRDLSGVYLAATYRLLRQDRLADKLIAESVFGGPSTVDYDHYHDGQIHDSQLLYILARHFPAHARRVSGAGIRSLVQGIHRGNYNTLSSAYTLLALETYARTAQVQGAKLAVSEVLASSKRPLPLPEGLFPRIGYSADARALAFTSSGSYGGFYSVVQAGFDRSPATRPIKRKLEVFREYTDADGKTLATVRLGDEIQARIRLRALGSRTLSRVVVVDMLPAGFELLEGTAHGSSWGPEHQDPREDRLVLYGTVPTAVKEYRYRLKATSVGRFTVPAVKAESLYDRTVVATSRAGNITVVER